jgi:NADP-dependent 3-hydroxy acid dehydrogenase YdfG
MSGIKGKVIAVTGASSGIGEATATHLAAQGARLVLGARREDRLTEVVDRITAQGGSAVGVVVDVRRREDLKRLTDVAVDRFGRLDVLVSNAGTMAVSPFDELRQDDWDAMVATHVTGLLNGIGAALPVFRRQRSGQFVNVASTAAYVVKSPLAVYAATKTAVKVLTEGLRQEAGPDLRVSLISPGYTNTEGVGKGAAPRPRRRWWACATRSPCRPPPSPPRSGTPSRSPRGSMSVRSSFVLRRKADRSRLRGSFCKR